jgi:MFS family permease
MATTTIHPATDTAPPAAPATTPPHRSTDPKPRRKAWVVVGLLFLVLVANYADKLVVGLAGIEIMKDLNITPAQFGLLQSSFFWLFAVGSILGGWLGGRIKVRWLLAGIAVLWALTMAPMIGQVTFGVMLACRVLLGFAEGPTTALAMQAAHSWFPARLRAIPTSLLVAGAAIGPVIAAPLVTWVIMAYSWHAAFAVLAGFGLLIALVWLLFGGEGAEAATADTHQATATATAALPSRVPLRRLFTTGSILGMLVMFFASYAFIAVKISWLPIYLRDALGYDPVTTGNLVALPSLGGAICVVLAGLASRAMTKRGMSLRASRGILPGVLVLLGGLTTITFTLTPAGPAQMALIIVSGCMANAAFGVAFTGISDVVPPKQRGVVFGIFTAVFSLGGIIAPIVLGRLVGAADTAAAGYTQGFLGLGALLVLGAIATIGFVNPERDINKLAAHA